MRKILITIIIFSSSFSFAQRRILDSIKQQVKIHKDLDTARAFYLNELAWQYLDYSIDSTEMYYSEALILSERLNYISGIITAKNTKGLTLRISNKFEEAIKVAEEVIALRKKYGPEAKLTGAYTNLGSIYILRAEYAKALKYLNKGLENAQKWKQIENQILILSNIAIVYNYNDLNDLALETFQKAVAINKKFNSVSRDEQQAQLYANIAAIYSKRGLNAESYKYLKFSYDFYKKENNTRQNSVVVFNMAGTTINLEDQKAAEFYIKEMEDISKQLNEAEYTASLHMVKANYLRWQKKFAQASTEVDKGLAIVDTINSLRYYGVLLGQKAECYEKLQNYKMAIALCEKALVVSRKAGDKSEITSIYKGFSEAYKGMNDYKKAFEYQEKATELHDSILNENFDTQMATLSSYNQLDKKERELALSNSENEKVSIENKRQTSLLIAGSIVGLLVFVLLIFSLRAYRVKQKDNVLLNDQKEEIEHQKDLVDEKQKEIVDSINYALQIQKTLIANHELVNETVPDSFVFFKPKDIVSGDFYWATKKDKRFYLAVCDSTGHGVPGAFMSLLNINYLNEAIKEKGLVKPSEVFDHVRKRLIETISQNGRRDGMDGILICMEENNNTITYAAANNKPILISENKLVELKCDKMPVGIGEKALPFSDFSFEGKKGDMLYLYTDGFPDQFGGPKGKKFKYKQLEELLLENNNLDVYKQEVVLKQKFENWIGPLEQVDDVCVLGIRLYTKESVYPGSEAMLESEKNITLNKNV
ncbi:MAG: tetratricopeptide repeat protein [Bacteroidia bacterium]